MKLVSWGHINLPINNKLPEILNNTFIFAKVYILMVTID